MATTETKACRDCGATIPLDARVCPQCGARQLTGGALAPASAGQSSGLNGCVVAALAGFGGIILIGIIAAIAIPKFVNTKQRAYVAAMKTDLRSIAAAEEAYHEEHGRYQERLDSLPGVTLAYGVRLVRLTANERGWRAVVRHDAVDTICTTGGGELKPEAGPPGTPFCSRPEAAERDSTS